MINVFLDLLEEFGRPNIYLITPRQFEWLEGDKVFGNYGLAADWWPAITMNPRIPALRGRVLKNGLAHEIIHVLLPEKEEWWVWLAGHIIAKGGDDGQTCPPDENGVVHTLDEMPTRDELVEMLCKASRRFNRLHKRRKR